MAPPSTSDGADRRPLLSTGDEAPPKAVYGAVEPAVVGDPESVYVESASPRSGSATPVSTAQNADGGKAPERVYKKFREIWPLCLGLWTA